MALQRRCATHRVFTNALGAALATYQLFAHLLLSSTRRAAARDENRRRTRSSLVLKVAHSCSAS